MANERNNLLQRCGEALYGPRWQSEMARDLDVSDRTVRRWIAGAEVPDGVCGDMLGICQDHSAELGKLIAALKRSLVNDHG